MILGKYISTADMDALLKAGNSSLAEVVKAAKVNMSAVVTSAEKRLVELNDTIAKAKAQVIDETTTLKQAQNTLAVVTALEKES